MNYILFLGGLCYTLILLSNGVVVIFKSKNRTSTLISCFLFNVVDVNMTLCDVFILKRHILNVGLQTKSLSLLNSYQFH